MPKSRLNFRLKKVCDCAGTDNVFSLKTKSKLNSNS